MNFRLSTPRRLRAAVVCAALCWGFTIVAQPLPAPAGPGAAGAAAPAPTTRPGPKLPTNEEKDGTKPFDVATLNSFVRENLTRIGNPADNDSALAEGMQARQDLVAASTSPNVAAGKLASTIYLDAYVNALARPLATLASDPKLTLRAKINVGVVAARVAENCKVAGLPANALQPILMTLMQDKNDAVALWGVKAAASLCTAGKPPATNPALIDQIVKTVSEHHLNGTITEEAYNALDGNPAPQVLAALISLFKTRVAAYTNGQVPSEPIADRRPSAILTVQLGAWSKLNATEQTRVMNLVADLLSAAVKAMTQPPAGSPPDTADQLKNLIAKSAEAVVVVANASPSMAALKQAADSLRNRTSPTPAAVEEVVDLIRKAFPMTQTAKQP
jgi:hypothetical protein